MYHALVEDYEAGKVFRGTVEDAIAERWFVSWKIEVEPTNEPKSVAVVGVDLGIKALATLSTGNAFTRVF